MSTLFPLYRISKKLILDAHINLYLLIFEYNYFFQGVSGPFVCDLYF